MKRNKNVEMVRGIALLFILFYHYTQFIPGVINTYFLQMLNEGLCQIAMVTFFSISGFGTYVYLDRHKDNCVLYVKKRYLSIAPQYYFCIVVLLFTIYASYLDWKLLPQVTTMFMFIHNLFISTNGIINGATWTLALMMQFYLIAPFVYKMVKKYKVKVYLVAIIVVFLFRMFISAYLERRGADSSLFVMYSIRQIYTTIDIFIGGMLVGEAFSHNLKMYNNKYKIVLPLLFLIIMGTFMLIIYTPTTNYVWGNNIRSWIWPSILGIEIAFLLFVCIRLEIRYNTIIGKFIQFIAKNEYGIYLWHLPLIVSVSSQSNIYQNFLEKKPGLLLLGMMLLAIFLGTGSNYLFQKNNAKN